MLKVPLADGEQEFKFLPFFLFFFSTTNVKERQQPPSLSEFGNIRDEIMEIMHE